MYQDLRVWHKSIELVKEIYFLTEKLPSKENYVLSNGTKDVFVSKIYLDDSITPHQIYLCYNINDTVYFDFTVYKSIFSNGEFPDDEFWFGFNVEVVDNSQTA